LPFTVQDYSYLSKDYFRPQPTQQSLMKLALSHPRKTSA